MWVNRQNHGNPVRESCSLALRWYGDKARRLCVGITYATKPQSTMSKFTPVVQSALSKMTEEEKLTFTSEFNRRKKSKGLLIFLSLFFPVQLLVLGKVGLGILFWFTAGGFGLWYVIEWFLTPGRVDAYNNEIATEVARDVKIMMGS